MNVPPDAPAVDVPFDVHFIVTVIKDSVNYISYNHVHKASQCVIISIIVISNISETR